ncbi:MULTISPECIES: hypothetical protein [Microcystis]|mgnify:CR=1 FL=1|uniref:hypothetical protein n=1 Tax=Microcystis TaxID=1125 RepID=UPI0013050D57|nr:MULTISPECIES: hypothetical protein [Microcystis]
MNCPYGQTHHAGHLLHQPRGDDSAARQHRRSPKNPKTGNLVGANGRSPLLAQEGTAKI